VNCDQMENLLSSFIDDELGSRDTNVLLAHLRACESCREHLEELRTLQQLHKKAMACRPTPVSTLAFTRKVMGAIQEREAKAPDVPQTLPSWRWREMWQRVIWERRWIAPAIAAAAAAVVLIVYPLSSPEKNLRPVSELKATTAEVAVRPDDMIEHYLTEHTISAVEAPLAGPAGAVQFVSYSR